MMRRAGRIEYVSLRSMVAQIGCAAAVSMLLALFSAKVLWAGRPDLHVGGMTPFFAKEIPEERSSDAEQMNAVLADILRSSREPITLLASKADHASLLVGADQHGFGTLIPLAMHAYGLHLAGDATGPLWIGGYSKPHYGIDGRQTFAYLAKVDRAGHLIWEREFGGKSERRIQSMALLPSGDIVVSATDTRKTWLAKISRNGDLVWERDVGVGKGSAVALVDGTIVLAGIEASSDTSGYREDVSIWSFTEAGEQRGHWVIREEINRVAHEYTEDIQVAQAQGGLYVISKWRTFAPFKPLEVARFDLKAGVTWRKDLPEAIVGKGSDAHICSLAAVALSSGDLVIACRVGADQINLLRLRKADGDLIRSALHFSSLPSNCDEPWSPAAFMLEMSPEAIWLFGSPRATGMKPCGWISEVPSPTMNR